MTTYHHIDICPNLITNLRISIDNLRNYLEICTPLDRSSASTRTSKDTKLHSKSNLGTSLHTHSTATVSDSVRARDENIEFAIYNSVTRVELNRLDLLVNLSAPKGAVIYYRYKCIIKLR